MSSPNIVNVTSIISTSATFALTTTQVSMLAAAATGHVLKVDSILVANKTAGAVTTTVNLYSAASLGGTAYALAYAISVPANATLIVSDKSTSFYVGEAQSIGASAGAATSLDLIIAWDDIS